ncbi:hypothetical protein F4779DRAFT_271865 [Xylariaceae sp. FL0662B]|nr:hypothetical protein F4779DRAFT_271865 [Xylariaceae sp. FL0662B]
MHLLARPNLTCLLSSMAAVAVIIPTRPSLGRKPQRTRIIYDENISRASHRKASIPIVPMVASMAAYQLSASTTLGFAFTGALKEPS